MMTYLAFVVIILLVIALIHCKRSKPKKTMTEEQDAQTALLVRSHWNEIVRLSKESGITVLLKGRFDGFYVSEDIKVEVKRRSSEKVY